MSAVSEAHYRLTPLSAIGQGPLGQDGLATAAPVGEALPVQVGQVSSGPVEVPAGVLRRYKREHYGKLGLGLLGAVLGAGLGIWHPDLVPVATAVTGGSLLFGGSEVQAHVRAGSRLVMASPSST